MCAGQRPVLRGFGTVRNRTLCSGMEKNPEQNAKRGCAQISAHPCESAASTLDDHNFLVRTPIRAFLDSTESSLSLEFNKIKCSAKMLTEHWAGSRTVEA